MKKTLVSIIAGLTVAGTAFALPTPDDRKAMCLKHPEKYVWVEKTQACVPINPCASSNSKAIINAYCYPLNGTTESVGNGISVWDVMDFYIEYKNPNCGIAKEKMFKEGKTTLVPCIGDDYLVFELSDDDVFLVTDSLCWIGGFVARMPYTGWPTQCEKASQDYCNVLKQKFGSKTKIKYEENGTCRIGKWADEYYKGEIWIGSDHKTITNQTDEYGNKKE